MYIKFDDLLKLNLNAYLPTTFLLILNFFHILQSSLQQAAYQPRRRAID